MALHNTNGAKAIGTQWIGLDWRNGGVPKVACLLQEASIVLTANMTRTSDSPQLVYRSVPKMVSSSITRGKGHLESSRHSIRGFSVKCRMLTLIPAILSMLLFKQAR